MPWVILLLSHSSRFLPTKVHPPPTHLGQKSNPIRHNKNLADYTPSKECSDWYIMTSLIDQLQCVYICSDKVLNRINYMYNSNACKNASLLLLAIICCNLLPVRETNKPSRLGFIWQLLIILCKMYFYYEIKKKKKKKCYL